MARASKPMAGTAEVRGLKYLRRITKLLRRLHEDATARDKAGNRRLFYDQYAGLVLRRCSARRSIRCGRSGRPA